MEAIAEFIRLALMLLCGVAPIFIGVYILAPLDRAARFRNAPFRYTMVDTFGLMFLIQLPMAVVSAVVPANNGFHGDDSRRLGLFLIAFVISTLVWWTAIRTFGKAGVTNNKHRLVLVFFVLPAGYYNAFLPWIAIGLFGTSQVLWALLLCTAIMVTTIAAGVTVRRIVKTLHPVVDVFSTETEPAD